MNQANKFFLLLLLINSDLSFFGDLSLVAILAKESTRTGYKEFFDILIVLFPFSKEESIFLISSICLVS